MKVATVSTAEVAAAHNILLTNTSGSGRDFSRTGTLARPRTGRRQFGTTTSRERRLAVSAIRLKH